MERNNKTGEVAEVVQCLPNKHEALSSNPTSKKKKKKRKEKRKQTTKSTIKNVGEKEPLYTVGGNEN
jgi:hypothetical protein